MSHPPAYEIHKNSPRPEINFNTADGNWVGIHGGDWGDQIGKNVTRLDKNILFEIWQPDLRADKIYSAEISDRVIHKLFPACLKKNILGTLYHSNKLLQSINDIKEKSIYQTGIWGKYHYDIVRSTKENDKVIGTIHGEIKTPLQHAFRPRKNQIRTIGHIIDHFKFKQHIIRYDIITHLSDINVERLKKYYNGRLYKISMGIDMSIFRQLDKLECRNKLNLSTEKKIILNVGRFTTAKQNHNLINILSELSDDYDFLAIYIGIGEPKFEDYLKKISQKLFRKKQIIFTGFLNPEILMKYYNSADLFFMSSASEGGPVVSMEALACGIPVITTDTGNVAKFISEHVPENVVKKYDYEEWKSILVEFLKGKKIKKIDIELVREKYSWNSIAKKFIEIYRSI